MSAHLAADLVLPAGQDAVLHDALDHAAAVSVLGNAHKAALLALAASCSPGLVSERLGGQLQGSIPQLLRKRLVSQISAVPCQR